VCDRVGVARVSRPRVLVVRHTWEAFKSTGTARLAALALGNLRIVDMAAENPEAARAELRALEDAWLLYPGPTSGAFDASKRPETLVVLDGTWRQTRKMQRRLPELSRFPRFSLPELPSQEARLRLRQPPRPGARSTLEAIADALALLDSPECGARLLDLHRYFVEQTQRARGKLHTGDPLSSREP